jgi:hypothetical protein
MKKFWLVLLSLGLIMAFSAQAMAVDVKVTGSYYAAGMYLNGTTFLKDGYYVDTAHQMSEVVGSPSTAFFYQRLRVQTDFIVSPCLKLITRFDAMERIWGGQRSGTNYNSDGTIALDSQSAGTRAENENIAFDWAYIEYVSPIGMFDVGYMDDGGWGTIFGDSSVPRGIVSWAAEKGPWTAFFQIVKIGDNSRSAVTTSTNVTDSDTDKYQGGGIYKWKGGEAGLLAIYYREASMRPISLGPGDDSGVTGNVYVLQPYVKANIGPVKLQAEVDYAWGRIKADGPSPSPVTDGNDLKVDNLAGWVDASVNLKQFYFGGSIAYVAGNDWNKYYSDGTVKGGFLTGGMDWNPTLILFNQERHYWAGPILGNNVTSTDMNFLSKNFNLNDTGMYNAWFFQGRAGIRPTDKLDIVASLSYAMADSKTLPGGLPNAVGGTYGTEIDLTGTYKITNNLTYMLGAGYLFTGDYFKGSEAAFGSYDVRDDFMFINKLTLNF